MITFTVAFFLSLKSILKFTALSIVILDTFYAVYFSVQIKNRKIIFFFEIDSELSETRFKPKIFWGVVKVPEQRFLAISEKDYIGR